MKSSNISFWVVGGMEFDLVFFLKVLLAIVLHTGILYFIFRQLDKLFGNKK